MALLSLSNAHLAFGHVAAARRRRVFARGRRAPRPDRPQRRRQVLAAEDPGRPREARRRPAADAPRACASATCRRSRCSTSDDSVFDVVSEGVAEARSLRAALRGTCAGRRPRRAADPHRGARRLELGTARRDHAATACTWTASASVGELQRRHEEARRAGAGAGRGARHAAARRADQPPRPRFDRLARGTAARLQAAR